MNNKLCSNDSIKKIINVETTRLLKYNIAHKLGYIMHLMESCVIHVEELKNLEIVFQMNDYFN
jgi:hypothetical protein